MKVSKGRSQPEIVAAAFLILYMVLGRPLLYQVLIETHMCLIFPVVVFSSFFLEYITPNLLPGDLGKRCATTDMMFRLLALWVSLFGVGICLWFQRTTWVSGELRCR